MHPGRFVRIIGEVPHDQLLICTVTADGGRLVSACTSCGWISAPVDSGQECGALWDEHRHRQHAPLAV